MDDKGNSFEISPDPLGPALQQKLEGIRLGDSGPFADKLAPILSDEKIFGIDLVKQGLADKIARIFAEMIAGQGAVTAVLEKYLE